MTLKYGKGTFEYMKPQEGEPVRIELPNNDKPLQLHHLPVASIEETKAFFTQVPVWAAKFEENMGHWRYIAAQECDLRNNQYIDGDRFKETADGLYSVRNGVQKHRVTNSKIRIVSVTERWKSEHEVEEFFRCRVSCPEAWGDTEREIDIPKLHYKDAYRHIHHRYPEVSLSTQDLDALEAYLTRVAQRDLSTLPKKIEATTMGWLKAGGSRFFMGTDSFYRGHQIPDIANDDRKAIFEEAQAFCDVGHGNAAIDTIWLFAHTPYSLFWFRQSNSELLRSVLFVKGSTNLLKSSLIRVVADVFRTDRLRSSMPLSSTPAAIQDFMVHLHDNLICLDDFSNTAGARNKEMIRNAETVIRAVGDGSFAGKMSTTDFSKIKTDIVRAQVVITGEDSLGLDASSLFRLIMIQFEQGTVDAERLRHFQENPSIMSRYFALYIQFLTEMGSKVTQHCKHFLDSYRHQYREELEIPRFIDAAVSFHLQADTYAMFAQYCGMSPEFCSTMHARTLQAAIKTLKTNQEINREASPILRFVVAFMQSVGTSKTNGLASTEIEYAANESSYIGFTDKPKNQIWVLFESATALVRTYYEKQGNSWLIRDVTLKELLLKEGISVGKYAGPGKSGNQYLCRARRGSRKRMLVLRTDKIEELLANVSEGED